METEMQNTSQPSQDIFLTENQRSILEKIVNASTSSKSLSKRASILLALANGTSKYQIVKDMEVSWPTVNKWQARWREASIDLQTIEKNQPTHKLKAEIIAILKDAPRSGAPCNFTEEQVTKIIALACSSPEKAGVPVTHWSCRLLAMHAKQLGIVKSISYKQINNFLKSGGIKTSQNSMLVKFKGKKLRDF